MEGGIDERQPHSGRRRRKKKKIKGLLKKKKKVEQEEPHLNDCEAVAPTIQAEFTSSKHTHIHATCLNAIFVGCFTVQQKKKKVQGQ